MLFKELAFFADFKRKVVKTQRHVYDYSAKSWGNFYASPCIIIAFENFRIRFIFQTKMKVFFINVQVT